MYWLPQFVAQGVRMGIGAAFSKDADLPDLPSFQEFSEKHPDLMRTDGEG